MTVLERLIRHIETYGPIPSARVSSAQSHTRYNYWGAVRYELRLTKNKKIVNRAVDRASSDRRSELLANRDCQALCDAEHRVWVQTIGAISESEAASILGGIHVGDMP